MPCTSCRSDSCGTYLFNLPRQHAALNAQHRGDVDVLPAHVVHPLGEALHRGLEEHPGELDDVKNSFDDVVCRGCATTNPFRTEFF